MKTAYKVLLGAVALVAAGYATARFISGTRSEPYVPDVPDLDDAVVHSDLAPADAAEIVDISQDQDSQDAAWTAGLDGWLASQVVHQADDLNIDSDERIERTGKAAEADLLEAALTRLVEDRQFQPARTEQTAPLAGEALKQELLVGFRDSIAKLTSGKIFTKKDVRVEVTEDEQGGQTLSLTRYNAQGGPCGHVVLNWVNGFSYRTDGCFARTRGSDLERVVDLLLIFETAIDDEPATP